MNPKPEYVYTVYYKIWHEDQLHIANRFDDLNLNILATSPKNAVDKLRDWSVDEIEISKIEVLGLVTIR